jgi:hypothetical protein
VGFYEAGQMRRKGSATSTFRNKDPPPWKAEGAKTSSRDHDAEGVCTLDVRQEQRQKRRGLGLDWIGLGEGRCKKWPQQMSVPL